VSDDREKLIRRHFEAMRDLTWAETLEPKFRGYDLSAAQMQEYREAWNRHTEARDWAWWHENTKESDEQLRTEINEMSERIERIDGLREFRELLGEAVRKVMRQDEKNDGMER
jgi:hypothetical protein